MPRYMPSITTLSRLISSIRSSVTIQSAQYMLPFPYFTPKYMKSKYFAPVFFGKARIFLFQNAAIGIVYDKNSANTCHPRGNIV